MNANRIKCGECEKTLKNKTQFRKHLRNIHAIKQVFKPVKCAESDCKESFSSLNEFRDHLETSHGMKHMTEHAAFSLPSREAFHEWLKDEELKTKTNFIILSGERKQKLYSAVVYKCSRSGTYKSKGTGKHQLKAQGSKKCGFHCPALINVKFYDTEVNVIYFHQHYKHDFNIQHIPLSISEKAEIAGKLILGMEPSRIVKDIRSQIDLSDIKRKDLITRKDVNNIKKIFKISSDGHPGFCSGPLTTISSSELNASSGDETLSGATSSESSDSSIILKTLNDLTDVMGQGVDPEIPDVLLNQIMHHSNSVEILLELPGSLVCETIMAQSSQLFVKPSSEQNILQKRFNIEEQNCSKKARCEDPLLTEICNLEDSFIGQAIINQQYLEYDSI